MKQGLWFILKIAVTFFIFWMLIHYSQLQFALLTTFFKQPFYTFVILVLLLFTILVNTARWYRLNSIQGIHLPYSISFIATYVGVAFNTLLPGSVGGDFIRCYQVMKQFPNKKRAAILSTFLDRACGLAGIIILTCIIAFYRLDVFMSNESLAYIFTFFMSIILISIILFFISLLLPENLGLIHWLQNKLPDKRWSQFILMLLEMFHLCGKSKLAILQAIIYSLISQLLLLMLILCINKMMGLPDIPPYIYMLALAVGQIANLIPLTPGGIGIGEAAFANIVLIFYPGVNASATVFLAFRLCMMVVYLPGALWGIFGFSGKLMSKETYIKQI